MEKETLYINLFGGPSISKSTTAAGVFTLLKLHDIDSEIVTEFAKDLVWENRISTLKDQRYLFGKQYHRLWRLKGNVDVVVTDSPLLLGIVYAKLNNYSNELFYNDIIGAIGEFNNFNIMLTRTKKYNPNGRLQTEEEAKKLDLLIENSLNEYNYDYTKVLGNYDAANTITEIILKNFGQELKYKIDVV